MSTTLPISVDELLRQVEAPRVEFKKDWSGQQIVERVVRTICAFANDYLNVNGGYVVLGVEDDDGTAKLPPRGLDPRRLEGIQAEILNECQRMVPPYQPTLSPEIVDGRHLLVIWAPPSPARPHAVPSADGPPRYFVRLGAQTRTARGQLLQQLLQLAAAVPFDDATAVDRTVEDLSATLVREYLKEAKRENLLMLDSDLELYRILRLVNKINGREAPRNVALLFFNNQPEEIFRGAYIRAAYLPDGAGGDVIEDHEFRGPLHRQVQSCLRYLMNLTTHHIRKNAHGAEATTWETYPEDAVREALVNAVLHRDYQYTPDPILVRVRPDAMDITSYPGPVPGLEPEHFRSGHQVPAPSARNRRIGELLRGLRLAEQMGTGVPRIHDSMRANGSPAPAFDFNVSRFTVTLPAHPGPARVVPAHRIAGDQKAESAATEVADRVVAVVDLSRYSELARIAEEMFGAQALTEHHQLIVRMIDEALSSAAVASEDLPRKNTGEGQIIVFDNAEAAHRFAMALHQVSRDHNRDKKEWYGLRYYRIGIASGKVISRDLAGLAVARASRLESQCGTGEILVDQTTFAQLPEDLRTHYGDEETIAGRSEERIVAHRHRVIEPAPWDR